MFWQSWNKTRHFQVIPPICRYEPFLEVEFANALIPQTNLLGSLPVPCSSPKPQVYAESSTPLSTLSIKFYSILNPLGTHGYSMPDPETKRLQSPLSSVKFLYPILSCLGSQPTYRLHTSSYYLFYFLLFMMDKTWLLQW
jgi:hypothetical protein